MPAQSITTRLRDQLERWLLRLPIPEPAPIRLNRRRIYVLPTPSGLALFATLVVMLIASINYNLSLGYALTFLIGGVGTASMFHAYRNLLELSIRPRRAEAVFCGEIARFALLIDNPRAQKRPALQLSVGHGTDRHQVDFELAAAGHAEIVLQQTSQQRGWLPIGRVCLETRWPLGFIRAWSVLHPDLDCLVYPQPEAHPPPLPAPAGGEDGRRLQGEGEDDFAGLRAHRIADSPRHVAWKVVARGGPLLTKTFEGAQGGELLLDWHELPSTLDTEARLARLTAWVCQAEHAGLRYGLSLPGQQIAPAQGASHLRICLGALALHGLPARHGRGSAS